MKDGLNRREFLKRTGLTVAVVATPAGLSVLSLRAQSGGAFQGFHPAAWFTLKPDGRVTVFVAKSEMGQGIHTALPMILADELEADWTQVDIEHAPVTPEYADPVQGSQVTYGSTSIRHLYEPLRKAGAAGRQMLVEAAAQKWNVSANECQASQGQVHHRGSGRSLSYGALAEAASALPVPDNPPLKEKEEFRLIGRAVARLDVPDKVNGRARFGIDSFVEGMLYGALARPPSYGARPASYDEQAARAVSGVRHVVEIDRGISVCADTLEAAWKGREALDVQWTEGTHPQLSNETQDALLTESLNQPGFPARNDPQVEQELAQTANQRVQAQYLLPYLSHATMEPMNCTAHVRSDGCDIWAPTQGQTWAQQKAAQITGLEPQQIQVHTSFLGGGFGRRAMTDFVEEAVSISKSTGTPVKLIWSREEDIQHDSYRPANSCRIEGTLNAQGRVTAWSHRVAVPPLMQRRDPNASPLDPPAVAGLLDLAYDVPNVRVEYHRIETPVAVTYWRSVGDSHNGFTVESFMDELAHASGQDPVEFRLRHLKHDPRGHRVLEAVAERAGWGQPLAGPAQGRGVACYPSHGSYIGQVAEVSVDPGTGVIRVHRIICAVDCGPVVNPDIVTAQMEGAATMGLSAALMERVQLGGGGTRSTNFFDYPILRMSQAPQVEVEIVESDAPLGGAGETALPPVAPAVANAVFAATGARLRQLPLTPERVLEGLSRG